jgi:hypothetical protein
MWRSQVTSLDTVDHELFIAGVRTAIRSLGGHPSTHLVDELLDERLTHQAASQIGSGRF